MAHPLELAYHWQPPVSIATIGAIVSITIVVRSQTEGWLAVALVLAGIWAIFMIIVWLRCRAYLMVDGPILSVRRYRRIHQLDGREVKAVSRYLTTHGAGFKIIIGSGARTFFVPAGLLKKGHTALFGWLLEWAPGAELDKGSRRTLEELQARGLVADPTHSEDT